MSKAASLVEQAHKQLLAMPTVLDELSLRGLPRKAVEHYKLGWWNKNGSLQRESWGLTKERRSDGKERSLWIPMGLVIPTIEPSGKVVRLKIRRNNWKEGDHLPKYVAISGSMNGLTKIGSSEHATMIVVESELDAYAVHYVAHDFACVVAVGSNIKNTDNVIDYLAHKVKHLLICHDNDEAGEKMLAKWQRLYPHAKRYPTPLGKDIGEAIQKGLDIRAWILQRIRS